MALTGSRVSVATTATALNAADSDTSSLLITNKDSVSVFLGDSTVTASGGAVGYELASGETVSFDLMSSERVYGIVAASTARVDVLRTGIG